MLFKTRFWDIIKKLDSKLEPLNFNINADFGGASVSLLESNKAQPMLDIGLPNGKLEATKSAKICKLLVMGMNIAQHDSVTENMNYFKNAADAVFDKYEYLKEFYSRVKSI
jgi:hypothetical protein